MFSSALADISYPLKVLVVLYHILHLCQASANARGMVPRASVFYSMRSFSSSAWRALALWLIWFFCSGLSWAAVQPYSGRKNSGS